MFEVRGARRPARGQVVPSIVTGDAVTLRHQELDGLPRTCVIAFRPAPASLSARAAVFEAAVSAEGRTDIFVEVGIEPADPPCQARFRAASARARHGMRSSRRRGAAEFSSSGRVFNEWLGKSRADLALLTTELATGPYPYAGIPWFSTAFGRDAVITALQTLWLDPTLAQGVLRFLAAHQAMRLCTSRTPPRARSCTRPARARWRGSRSCPSAATTAASTRRPCSWCWRAPTPTAPGTSP